MENIRIGLVGTGTVSGFHAKAIKDAEGVVLAGACSNSKNKAEEFCKTNNAKYYASYEQMLNSNEIDAVAICTPNMYHAEQILDAVKAGKHVIVEKPMAISLDDADAVVDAARKNSVVVTSVCQHRFTEEAQAIKKAINSGKLGKIVLASLSMRFFRSEEYYAQNDWRGTIKGDGGGILMNQGIHGIDLLCYLVGKPVEVCGYAGTLLRNIEVEDTVAGAILFEEGTMASIDATVCANPSYSQKIFISGEKGTILLDEDEISIWTLDEPCPVKPRGNDGFTSASGPTAINYAFHTKQYEDFAKAIRTGTAPLIDAQQGRLPVEVILGLYQSSKERRSVPIRDITC